MKGPSPSLLESTTSTGLPRRMAIVLEFATIVKEQYKVLHTPTESVVEQSKRCLDFTAAGSALTAAVGFS